MPLVFPTDPAADESLAGFVVRATAENFLRSPSFALSETGIKLGKIGSLCSRTPSLACSIAEWSGTKNVEAIARMFHPPIEGRAGWIAFFGEPIRALYRHSRRRVAPAALRNGDYARATWSLNPLSFDPLTKERLIDACPQCKRALGWTRTYGVAYCDYCSRPETVGQFTFYYPGLDLRDFPQPKIEVEDEEALDFLIGLIDPVPGRKERSRKQVPEMWSSLGNGDLFEVGMTFSAMLNVDYWDTRRQSVRRKAKAGEGWEWLTPRLLSIGGRALMDGQPGFEAFGDIVRREAEGRPREKKYGKRADIGPLSTVDPTLCEAAKTILIRATETYMEARRDPDMQPLKSLAKKYGIRRERVKSLADSGLVPTSRIDAARHAPVLMSAAALEPLVLEMKTAISGTKAAQKIGVHQMYLDEVGERKILEPIDGPVLKLLQSGAPKAYYTRSSVDALTQNIAKRVKRRAPADCVRLSVALRSCNVRSVPWPEIVQAILDGRLAVFDIKSDRSRRSLADRLAVNDKDALSSVIAQGLARKRAEASDWIGNVAASEILGVNATMVWALVKVGALEKHDDGPLYSHFRRSEVELLHFRMIFSAEIVAKGNFRTYREASSWLRQQGVRPRFELKKGGWKVYSRSEVESLLEASPPERTPARRRTGRPDPMNGELAAKLENSDASRIGHLTAAAILGCSTLAVQRLAANAHLRARGGSTPFLRTEVVALAKRIVFLPEVMRLSGYASHTAVTNWLTNVSIEPLFRLKKGGGVPVFERAVIEDRVARAGFVYRAHAGWIRYKLLNIVARGNTVHQAAIACGVSYPTAKRWAASEMTMAKARGVGGCHPPSTKRKLLDMVKRGSSISRAAISCGVGRKTAQRWANAERAA
jgi:hypothetical protein